MKFPALLAIGCLVAGLVACSDGAPMAPIGLDKRPANSPETVASLTAPHGEGTPVPLQGTPSPARSDLSGVASPEERGTADLVVFIVSDFSAPRGLGSLSPGDKAAILAAAKKASQIVLYCRGDRVRPSRAIRTALILRGAQIRRFLVAQGVDPSRIRMFARSAGGFIADNTTRTGRAKNRRVEIHFA